ncbi:MAG: PP2C family protein-serine/threonine phosphatase, partial [Methanocorpusculum sp.]|nr:PP2C family protein-serine/threonine phosphatase [Methanocorpusculum sp.]
GLSFIRVAMYTPTDPAKVLSFVNKQLRKRNGKSLFMTVLCGVYSLNSNEVVFASAGLNPPVKIDKNGVPQLIKQENCLPLAITDDSEYQNIRIKLEPGETLFIYTDEILYSMNKQGDCFGTERLLESLRNAPQHSAKSIGKAVLRAVRNFSGESRQMDDMTILLFKKFE